MKSWAAANPAKPVAIAPDAESFWWCKHCHRVTEPLDRGEVYPQCVHCHGRQIYLRALSPARGPKPPPAPVPAHSEQARVLFAQLKGAVA